MKKYAYFLTILLLLIGAACQDILEEDPQTFLSETSFYQTPEDAILATNATYSRLFQGIIQWYYPSVATDVSYQGLHNQRPVANFTEGLNPTNGDATGMWLINYQGITHCNTAIEKIPSIEMDADLQARLIGEAKFNRAVYYFDLVRIYGAVPLVTTKLQPSEAESLVRNSVEEVYTQIVSDLNDAIDVLPPAYDNENVGRATSWAARGLLARVSLFREDHTTANTQLDAIINSGEFGLVDNFESLFEENNEHQPLPNEEGNLVTENIFDIQFKQDERQQAISSFAGSRDTEIEGGANGLGGGWENNLPTIDFLAMFEPGDLRQRISYLAEIDGNELESPRSPAPAGPVSGKWVNFNGQPTQSNNSGQNLYYIRYADVLLMKAEVENELNNGPTPVAYDAINQVRERAGLPPLSGLDYDSFTEAVRKERAIELSFEGHRRYDLIRWGIYVETVRNTTEPNMAVPRANIQDFHTLMPVPQRERDLNPALTQNPGYE